MIIIIINTTSHSRHTGGTMIYVKKELQSRVLLKKSIKNNLWLTGIEIVVRNKKFMIFSLYHSPSASDAEFLNQLEEILEEYSSKEGIFVLIGDYNIDMSKNTYYSNKFNKLISENGLYQNVSNFTRITANTSTIIDLLITNDKHLISDIHVTPKITNHYNSQFTKKYETV